MASLKNLDSRSAVSISGTSNFLPNLSKLCEPGGTYRVIFPTEKITTGPFAGKDAIVTGLVAGRSLDTNIFGRDFMVYADDWFDIDETNTIVDKMGVSKYTEIMNLIYDAQYHKEVRMKEEECKRTQEQTGVDQGNALNDALNKIKLKYYGQKGDGDAQSIAPKLSRPIGGMQVAMYAEAIVIPVNNQTQQPEMSRAAICSKKLSKTLLNTLNDFLDSSDYNNPDKDFIEVTYKFGQAGQSRKDAGQSANWSGIPASISYETVYANDWATYIVPLMDKLAGGPHVEDRGTVILKHAGKGSTTIKPQDLASKIKNWLATGGNIICLTYVEEADEHLKSGAKFMIEMGMLDSAEKIKEKFAQYAGDTVSPDVTGQIEAATSAMAPTPAPVVSEPTPAPAVEAPVVNPAPAVEAPMVNPMDIINVPENVDVASPLVSSRNTESILGDDDDADIGGLDL